MKMKQLIWISQLVFVFSTLALKLDQQLNLKKDDCGLILREAKAVQVESSRPPNLSGHWTSSRCEIRPGPEFVLRKYFFRNKDFHTQMFNYADEDCSDVTHYISAKGSVKQFQRSWTTPGGYEANYQLQQVDIIPYTAEKARTFGKLMRRYCKQSGFNSFFPNKKFRIFQFTKYNKSNGHLNSIKEDFDCLKLFNFTLNELQLVRVEKRRGRRINNKAQASGYRTTEELLLGDISTNVIYRRQYRPTHYQIPLLKSKTVGCEICQIISNASQLEPPTLHKCQLADTEIVGEWVSQRCESRPNGQYLTRHLSILADRKSWQGVYEFYNDPLCIQSNFAISAKGTYTKHDKSSLIPSARNFVFKTTRLKVTPQDFQMVNNLNSDKETRCGKPGAWRIGVTQDVTVTKGCLALGIKLPNIEFELVRTICDSTNRYLFVGQRPSDFASLSVAKNRPTSFQSALVQCRVNLTIFNDNEPFFEQYADNGIEEKSYLNTASSETGTSNTGDSNSSFSLLFAVTVLCYSITFIFNTKFCSS